MTDEIRERLQRLQEGGRVTRRDYTASLTPQLRDQLERSTPQQRAQILAQEGQWLDRQIARLQALNPARSSSAIEAFLANSNQGGGITPDNRLEGIAQIIAREQGVSIDVARNMASSAYPRSSVPGVMQLRSTVTDDQIQQIARTASQQSQLDNFRAQRQVIQGVVAQGTPDPSGVNSGMAVGRGFQSRSFSSGEQFYGDILQNVLGRGELEQRNFQQQMENDARLLDEVRNLRQDVRDVANPAPR
jgi:hypothetical protein